MFSPELTKHDPTYPPATSCFNVAPDCSYPNILAVDALVPNHDDDQALFDLTHF